MKYNSKQNSQLVYTYIYVDNFNIFKWLIQLVHLDVFNRVNNLESRKDTPKYCVFLVQPRRCCRGNEELRTVRVWTCISHADGIRAGCSVSKRLLFIYTSPTYRSCLSSSSNSSSNSLPQIDVPPVPSPSGSPVWIINFAMTRWNIIPSKYPLLA